MSEIKVKVTIENGDKKEAVIALADTGSTYTTIPKSLASKLGIEYAGFWSADVGGKMVTMPYSFAKITYKGRTVATNVWIHDKIKEIILGVTTLENLGFVIDYRIHALKRTKLRAR